MVDRKVEYADRKLSQADINRKISEFQRILQNTRLDPRPLGKELYDIFVKPIEGDLQGAGAKTILWSLDGPLRYIPMAALSPDGKTYLAEKYQNVIVTLARQSKLFDEPTGKEWRALGAGVSKPHEGFSALPSVVNEINAIVREGSSTGVLEGKKLIDEKFDLEALRETLPSRTEDGKAFNVVHLATHFKLGANDQDSALLLGDGRRLSLFEIGKDEDLDFRNVDLLTLSACQTAIAAGDGSGREVESLGMLAQKKGARAVLATLWKVADDPTAAFMSEFYRLKNSDPRLSKSEAIRLTQLAMIQGKLKPTSPGGGCRADEFGSPEKAKEFKCDPNAPFSHPASWSPFILIGNWR
jgi:CHAT domain-containing protein